MTLQLACEQMTDADRIAGFCQCQLDDLVAAGYDVEDVIDAASDAVVVVTNGQVKGRCQTTVRPCADTSCMCGNLADGCMCCRLDAIRLPGWAVEIDSVTIDGELVAPSTYGWLDGDGLVRIGVDVPRTWPGCQKLYLEDTEEGTFAITYTHGLLPFTAVMAATEIACDLVTGLTSTTSRLDRRVISAIMDGVTVDLNPDTLGMFDWVQRLAGQYTVAAEPWAWSPEADDGWRLHTLRGA